MFAILTSYFPLKYTFYAWHWILINLIGHFRYSDSQTHFSKQPLFLSQGVDEFHRKFQNIQCIYCTNAYDKDKGSIRVGQMIKRVTKLDILSNLRRWWSRKIWKGQFSNKDCHVLILQHFGRFWKLRIDGKRPDDMSLFPRINEIKLLDFNCSGTLAPSYVENFAKKDSKAGKEEEDRKIRQYEHLSNEYDFIPISVESFGTWGELGLQFIKDVGKSWEDKTQQKRSKSFLLQALSIAFQRGNALAPADTLWGKEEILDNSLIYDLYVNRCFLIF